MKDACQPADLSGPAWDAFWGSFTAQMGDNWGVPPRRAQPGGGAGGSIADSRRRDACHNASRAMLAAIGLAEDVAAGDAYSWW